MSYTLDLASVVGSTSAYVGFTSATGGSANDHKLLDWKFAPEVLTYSLTGNGADDALFTIDPIAGDLSFVNAPDADGGTDNVYNVQIQVTDGTNPITQDITVTVTDVNEAPPTITSSATATIAENTIAVTTVTATDPDSGATLTYSISDGADQALFTIDPATGVLSFNTAPDFETPGMQVLIMCTTCKSKSRMEPTPSLRM